MVVIRMEDRINFGYILYLTAITPLAIILLFTNRIEFLCFIVLCNIICINYLLDESESRIIEHITYIEQHMYRGKNRKK